MFRLYASVKSYDPMTRSNVTLYSSKTIVANKRTSVQFKITKFIQNHTVHYIVKYKKRPRKGKYLKR
jgi:hypothetical protein